MSPCLRWYDWLVLRKGKVKEMYGLLFQLTAAAPFSIGHTATRRCLRIAGACAAVLGIVTTVGCSAMRTPLVMDVIKAGRIAGVPTSAVGTFIFPGRADWRRYEQVALLQNVHIGTAARVGSSADRARWEGNYSFVLGRRTSDGEWEIISVSARADDGTWREVRQAPSPHFSVQPGKA